MKYRTTAKVIRAYYPKIICIGYCNLQYLLHHITPEAYTCGGYGWNADIYDYRGIAICTGYRPFGNIRPNYDIIRKYDNAARAIINAPYTYKTTEEYRIESEKREAQLEELLNKFIGEVIKEG